jgi:hypothetical protein
MQYYQIPQQSHHNAKVFVVIIMPQLRYTVEHFSYIPPILVVWRRTTSQTGVFDIDKYRDTGEAGNRRKD